MIRAYDEIVEFIAAGTTPASVAGFEPSQGTKDCVAELIRKEKTVGLTAEEASELDHFLKLEHLMRLAKARARRNCGVVEAFGRGNPGALRCPGANRNTLRFGRKKRKKRKKCLIGSSNFLRFLRSLRHIPRKPNGIGANCRDGLRSRRRLLAHGVTANTSPI